VTRFTGTARWTEHRSEIPHARLARLAEVGELVAGPHRGDARRALDYVQTDRRGVSIAFLDGRPFVDLDLAPGRWRAVHRCGRDDYEISTVAVGPDHLEERWRVRGPTKQYDATTRLTRLP
jgi:hypothetical protein